MNGVGCYIHLANGFGWPSPEPFATVAARWSQAHRKLSWQSLEGLPDDEPPSA